MEVDYPSGVQLRLYAIRTSLEEAPDKAEGAAHYQRRPPVESAFQTLKTVITEGAPDSPSQGVPGDRVRVLCMLAC